MRFALIFTCKSTKLCVQMRRRPFQTYCWVVSVLHDPKKKDQTLLNHKVQMWMSIATCSTKLCETHELLTWEQGQVNF